MCRTILKEIEYKEFKTTIYKEKHNPSVVCTKEVDGYDDLKYFFTNKFTGWSLSYDEIVVKQEILFKERIDYFYTEIESVNKDNLYELLSKYAIVHVPDYDFSYSFIDENIFKIIMNQYNKNNGIRLMKNPNIKTKVVHSETKSAWNVVGVDLGYKYKIARIPYICSNDESITERNRVEALEHAAFISKCFNNAEIIISVVK